MKIFKLHVLSACSVFGHKEQLELKVFYKLSAMKNKYSEIFHYVQKDFLHIL